jgi:hypothetical protein
MVDLGKYIANSEYHANCPKVDNKIDLLQITTGKSKGYRYIPNETDVWGQRSLGNHSNTNGLFAETFDLRKTPYLYYSINQAPSSRCTFALYTNCDTYNGWWIGRNAFEENGKKEEKPKMLLDHTAYDYN